MSWSGRDCMASAIGGLQRLDVVDGGEPDKIGTEIGKLRGKPAGLSAARVTTTLRLRRGFCSHRIVWSRRGDEFCLR